MAVVVAKALKTTLFGTSAHTWLCWNTPLIFDFFGLFQHLRPKKKLRAIALSWVILYLPCQQPRALGGTPRGSGYPFWDPNVPIECDMDVRPLALFCDSDTSPCPSVGAACQWSV